MRYVISALILAYAPAALAQSHHYSNNISGPYPGSNSAAPINIPLAPVLDPNFREKETVTSYVSVPEDLPAGWQLTEVLKNQPMAAPFREAVARAGLDRQIDTVNGFTAFVPVVAGGHSTSDPLRPLALDRASREELSKWVVNQRINIALIPGNGNDFKALDGSRVRIQKVGDEVRMNGFKVVDSLKTPQGFVYYINMPVTRM